MSSAVKLTPAQQAGVLAYNLKEDYSFFIRWMSQWFPPEIEFHDYVDEVVKFILEIVRKRRGRGIVNLPPRHGKTSLCCHYLIPWLLFRNPRYKVIYGAYSDSFAWSQSARAKNIYTYLQSYLLDRNFFIPPLSTGKQSDRRWGVSERLGGGQCLAVGRGGSITGHGGNLFLLDDQFKNHEEAASSVIREKVWDEWMFTYNSRLEGAASVLHFCTRMDIDDLSARLLERGGWELLSIRAENEKGVFPLGRFDKAFYVEKKKEVSAQTWESLYQQNPSIPSGNFFNVKDIRFYEEKRDYCLVDGREERDLPYYFFIDTALKDSETSSFFCLTICSYTSTNKLLVRDIIRRRIEYGGYMPIIKNKFAEYRPNKICIEDKLTGTVSLQELAKDSYPVSSLQARGQKIDRAEPFKAMLERGDVYFKKHADYYPDLERELLTFPREKDKDQIDTLAYAAIFLQDRLQGERRDRVFSAMLRASGG